MIEPKSLCSKARYQILSGDFHHKYEINTALNQKVPRVVSDIVISISGKAH